ncbi:FecR family protein [bacterium SCSIO 12827]|nr:FecR family protein [bacterium SCSIO 12827]
MSDRPKQPVSAAALEQAAAWFARIDRGDLSDREQQAFDGWLAADPGHQRAFERISRTWDALGDLAGTVETTSLAGKPATDGYRTGRRWALGAVAAGLVLALGLGTDLPQRIDTGLRADAVTAVGETRTVSLPDGSTAQLNTASAIAVDFGPDDTGPRRVRLLRGEAAFDVVKNPDRPFTVAAGGGISRVLGTVFSVRVLGDGASVTLLEGRVAVAATDGGAETILALNQRVSYGAAGGLGAVETVDPQSAAAWRRDKLVFRDRALGAVIDELNRYHAGLIRLTGAGLRQRRVNGVFDTRDPVAVVGALETALGLRSTRLTDYLILLHQ